METLLSKETYSFLQGGGEMGERTRQFNWSLTPVGTPDQWPQSLRTTVSNLLRSKFPMFLWWGEDMIQFYNDAYRPSLGNEGKHPTALGQKGKECWPEIWEIISPLLHQVQTTGEATWMEDQLVPIYRNGSIEDVYWTFSYSSVLDDEGNHAGILVTCTETTEKVITQQKLIESEKMLRNTILQAPVAICIYRGHELIIEEANEPMFEFWGKTSEQVLHRPLFEAMPEAKNQGYEEMLANVFQTGQPFSANELTVTLPRDGEIKTVYINFSFTPIHETDGSISGIMAMATDVTAQVLARNRIEDLVKQRTLELAEANNALLAANQELKRSNTNLEEFAYAASHDLKEPIRKIHYFTDRLRHRLTNKLDAEDLHYFKRLETGAKRMSTLIDDLLSYSHISRGANHEDLVDLNHTLALVEEDMELSIAEMGATLIVDPLPIIKGHRRQLQQMFENLVGNALKYNRPDVSPEIKITSKLIRGCDSALCFTSTQGEKMYYLIEVIDNGIGFDQEDAERIFNVFTRLHGMAEYKGSGVGLSIVRKVAENHSGFVVAESKLGEGAIFKILLPADL